MPTGVVMTFGPFISGKGKIVRVCEVVSLQPKLTEVVRWAVRGPNGKFSKGFCAFEAEPLLKVHDQVTLRLNNDQTGKMLVQITDAFGAVKASYAFSKTAEFMQVNLTTSNLAAGIYFVRIQVGNKGLVKKIVKL